MHKALTRAFSRLHGTALGLLIAGLAAPWVQAQGLPPIYDGIPTAIAPSEVVASFPQGTFLENIAVGKQGDLFVTSYLDGKIFRMNAAGKRAVWSSVDGTIAGIALNLDGSALVSGWLKGREPAVFWIDAKGRPQGLTKLAGGMFPNGVLLLGKAQALIADSYRGAIWEVDIASKSAKIWIEDELLARANPDNPTPAVNGLKMFDGALYASNTANQTLIKIPIVDGRAGKPQVVVAKIGLDDFDFDRRGNLYGATHVYNSLVKVAPNGSVTLLGGLDQGMAGCTAVAVVEGGDALRLFVTTNGGMSMPPEGGVQPGKVLAVRLTPSP